MKTKAKLIESKRMRISTIIFVWVICSFGFPLFRLSFDLKPWMFHDLFTVLIPTTAIFAALIALFFKHYPPSQKVKSELRNDFTSLIRNLFSIAIICIILLPFSEVLGKFEPSATFSIPLFIATLLFAFTPIFVLIAIILFATYTFYDAFAFIKEFTSVDWKQNETGEKK
ncbi:MAG TPA: hypothetical protein C5S37_05625 [Methanophagales archaeon]|nr:hypothetical protein [Methanophagales archaeon]